MHDLLDSDGYPTEETLKRIREWPRPFIGLMDLVTDVWHWPEFVTVANSNEWTLVTGGWSGNEAIIEALKANVLFWSWCWQSSNRGGKHQFILPRLKA
jgi:hypothetical protein